MRLPKNIKTMSDAERRDWVKSLSARDYNSIADKAFKADPEWFVYWEDNDDEGTQGPNIYECLERARKDYDAMLPPETIAKRIEKVTGWYNAVDTNLEDREFELVIQFGVFTDDEQSATPKAVSE